MRINKNELNQHFHLWYDIISTEFNIRKNVIHFITKNKNKFHYATSFFSNDLHIIQLNKETPEIQAEDNKKIAEYSASWAANKYNSPIIKEDVGLYITALNGFPGPYLSYIEQRIEINGFLNLLSNKEDRSAYWNYSIAYCEPNSNPVSFTAYQSGTISENPKGGGGYATDKIFIPDNENRTISQLLDTDEYRRKIEHYEMLSNYLETLIISP